MERRYTQDPVSIRPWHSATGIAVADAKIAAGSLEDARLWFRRVLVRDPLNPEALQGLATVLNLLGDTVGAEAVCAELSDINDESC